MHTADAIALSAVLLAFPVCAVMHHGFGVDRSLSSHVLSSVFTVAVYAWLLLPLLRRRPGALETTSLRFVGLSIVIHLTWESIWLIWHQEISADMMRGSRRSIWWYPWHAYLDGGDSRYRVMPGQPIDPTLLLLEILSVCNGVVGAVSLASYQRSTRSARGFVIAMMGFVVMATYHLASTLVYFGTEIVTGLPNVNTDSLFDVVIKFFFVNSPWLFFPFFVVFFVYRRLGEIVMLR
jgi:hypothetical protein